MSDASTRGAQRRAATGDPAAGARWLVELQRTAEPLTLGLDTQDKVPRHAWAWEGGLGGRWGLLAYCGYAGARELLEWPPDDGFHHSPPTVASQDPCDCGRPGHACSYCAGTHEWIRLLLVWTNECLMRAGVAVAHEGLKVLRDCFDAGDSCGSCRKCERGRQNDCVEITDQIEFAQDAVRSVEEYLACPCADHKRACFNAYKESQLGEITRPFAMLAFECSDQSRPPTFPIQATVMSLVRFAGDDAVARKAIQKALIEWALGLIAQ